jgi:serine/threonine protein kinase/Tol biopolymer transport system component
MPEPIEQVQRAFTAYTIERELGSGGMATVYLAHDKKHDRRVAIKILHAELAAVLGAERFLQEIKLTANLQHPHILGLIDSGIIGDDAGELRGRPYYVMPFVEGESLRQRLDKEQQLPVSDSVRIATEVASALDYAHRHGVIHRDIKPENILLHDGSAIVADFGIALAVTQAGGARITQTGLSLGTPGYMSPEQAMGERTITARSDIYSLGAVTYEMLSGEPPFTGPTVQAVVARVMTEEPRPLTSQRRSVPPHIEAAVSRALEKLPADRFVSAHEFAEALNDPSLTSPTVSRAGPRRRKADVMRDRALISLAAVAALTAATGWWHVAHTSPDPKALAVAFVVTPAGRESVDPATIAISPDGGKIVYMGEEADHRQLYVRKVDDLNATPIQGTEGANLPFFSPDGKWLAFFASGELKRVPTDGGMPITVARNLAPRPSSWTKDNRILIPTEALARKRSGLSVVSPSGGIPKVFIVSDTTHGENMRAPLAVGDGKTILFASLGPGGFEDDNLAVGSTSGPDYKVFDFLIWKPLAYVDGYAICLRWDGQQGTIVALPFDLRERKITGDPVTLLTGIANTIGTDLSESGTLGYTSGTPTSELIWEGPSGKEESLLADLRAYATPRLSPDGGHIAFWLPGPIEGDVWIYSISEKTLSRLANWAVAPEWTPDGTKVMWVRPSTALAGIWMQSIDGSGPAEQVKLKIPAGVGTPTSAVMAPDGSTILFSAFAGAHRQDLFYFKVGAENSVRPWLATDADEHSPRFSPDGRWVAYASDESGAVEVYVRAFPSSGGRLQISSSGGTEPIWSRDGRHLFYRSGPNLMEADLSLRTGVSVVAKRRVMAMNARTTGGVSAENTGASLSANYDVSADGKRIMFPKRSSDDAKLVVVSNWLSAVRKKLAESRK